MRVRRGRSTASAVQAGLRPPAHWLWGRRQETRAVLDEVLGQRSLEALNTVSIVNTSHENSKRLIRIVSKMIKNGMAPKVASWKRIAEVIEAKRFSGVWCIPSGERKLQGGSTLVVLAAPREEDKNEVH